MPAVIEQPPNRFLSRSVRCTVKAELGVRDIAAPPGAAAVPELAPESHAVTVESSVISNAAGSG